MPWEPSSTETRKFGHSVTLATSRAVRVSGGPRHPILRANPSPEVTDQYCRLPLPTLFYLARGYTPWRPDADCGTTSSEINVCSNFQGPLWTHLDPSITKGLFHYNCLSSGQSTFKAVIMLKRKDNSSRGTHWRF